MPTHLEDSDGNNADDDSIDSFMQRQNNFGYRENDDVPTRDVGPERLPNLFSQVKNWIIKFWGIKVWLGLWIICGKDIPMDGDK